MILNIVTREDYHECTKRLEKLKECNPKTEDTLEEMAHLTFLIEKWDDNHEPIDLE